MQARYRILLALTLLIVGPAFSPVACGVTFHRVVDTVGTYGGFQFTQIEGFQGINNQAQVMFIADTTTGVQGVFVADAASGSVDLLLDDSGIYSDFFATFINDSGLVAVGADRSDGEQVLLTVDLIGNVTELVDSTGPLDSFQVPASINAEGQVVFLAFRDDGGREVLLASGSTPLNATTVIDNSFASYFLPIANDNRQVAYFGTTTGMSEIVVENLDTSAQTTIAAGSSMGPFQGIIPYDLGDNGDVVFTATTPGGVRSIQHYDDSTGATSEVAGPASGLTFTTIPEATVNGQGQIVFDAGMADLVPWHITDSGPQPLIAVGDAQFGSPLVGAVVGRALNDNGLLAMYFGLDDGTVGIAIAALPDSADVPEPSSALIVAIGIAVAARRRIRVRFSDYHRQ